MASCKTFWQKYAIHKRDHNGSQNDNKLVPVSGQGYNESASMFIITEVSWVGLYNYK